MRLKRIERHIYHDWPAMLHCNFQIRGQSIVLNYAVPDGWNLWDKEGKKSWVLQKIQDHLATHNHQLGQEVIFPDVDAPEQAATDFEGLPGLATWTAREAADDIEENVTDLASAKTALKRMARAIVYLRDIAIER